MVVLPKLLIAGIEIDKKTDVAGELMDKSQCIIQSQPHLLYRRITLSLFNRLSTLNHVRHAWIIVEDNHDLNFQIEYKNILELSKVLETLTGGLAISDFNHGVIETFVSDFIFMFVGHKSF